MPQNLAIVGVLVDDREDKSPLVQEVLAHYGRQILMRAGVPSPDRKKGLIALALDTDGKDVGDMAKRLEEIGGVTVRTLNF